MTGPFRETISVIVPAYQAEMFLENCITSIRRQTYDNLEILIIDNGSTDATGEIADRLQKEDGRIRVIREENRGVSGARNTGIGQAAGDYLTFVDADDRLAPDMLKKMYEVLQSEHCDVAGCAFLMTDSYNTLPETVQTDTCSTEQSLQVMGGREFIRTKIFDGDTRCWSKLYRKEAVGSIRFRKELTIGEDMLFLLEIMKQDIRVVHLDYPGYYYYHNPKGAMEREFTPDYMDQITCWQEAQKQVMELFPDDGKLAGMINKILLLSVMLVVGKLAMSDRLGAGEKRVYVRRCLMTIREMKREDAKQAMSLLGRSDRLKIWWFSHMPHSYLFLWKILKKIHAI